MLVVAGVFRTLVLRQWPPAVEDGIRGVTGRDLLKWVVGVIYESNPDIKELLSQS